MRSFFVVRQLLNICAVIKISSDDSSGAKQFVRRLSS